MMSVHDAVEEWQAGGITYRRAMDLTGTSSLLDLYALAEACEVDIVFDLRPEEARTVEVVVAAIERAFAREIAEARPA